MLRQDTEMAFTRAFTTAFGCLKNELMTQKKRSPHQRYVPRMAGLMALVTALVVSGVATDASAQIGDVLRLQGQLLGIAGNPVPDGEYGLTIRFYKTKTAKQATLSYIDPGVKVRKGAFTLTIGGKTKIATTTFLQGDAAYVGVQVGSDPELPRFPLHQVPYALRAKMAAGLACSGCIKTTHLAADVLAPFAKKTELQALSGKFVASKQTCKAGFMITGFTGKGVVVCAKDRNSTYTGKNFALAGKACAKGSYINGINAAGLPTCVKERDTTYSGKNFALSTQACAKGSVLRGIDQAGKIICVADKDSKNPADAMTTAQVANLRANKLANGTKPWTDGKQHKHTYNVNDPWLRDEGDNTNVKLYGNVRQMVFRTDGAAQYASGVGSYPWVWMFGGDKAANRRMMVATDGGLWTSKYGWLDTKFQPKGSYLTTAGGTITGNLTVNGVLRAQGKLYANKNIEMSSGVVIDAGGGWHRSYAKTGWYNGTYGGGIYMEDTTYVRTYNGKAFRADGGLYVGTVHVAKGNQSCPAGQYISGFTKAGTRTCAKLANRTVKVYQCPTNSPGLGGGTWGFYGCMGQITVKTYCTVTEYPKSKNHNCPYIGEMMLR